MPFSKRMAGTTGLEPAASAVTVSGSQVLSTTWKSTDGTRSHWKYMVDDANVYRDVYRGSCPHLGDGRGDRSWIQVPDSLPLAHCMNQRENSADLFVTKFRLRR